MIVHEQDAKGSSSNDLNYTQENGVMLRPLGGVSHKYTFSDLLKKGYVPFTLKELIGEDPVEPGKVWIGNEFTAVENGRDMTLEEICNKTLFGNYALCTMEFQVKSPEGKVLASYDPCIETYPSDYDTPMRHMLESINFDAYANGSNTIHIYVRLSNGELLEAFNTILKIG